MKSQSDESIILEINLQNEVDNLKIKGYNLGDTEVLVNRMQLKEVAK